MRIMLPGTDHYSHPYRVIVAHTYYAYPLYDPPRCGRHPLEQRIGRIGLYIGSNETGDRNTVMLVQFWSATHGRNASSDNRLPSHSSDARPAV